MTRLSVNINKVATIRNARGGNIPDVIQFAINCESYGADGITVHPRPDERHITKKDVYDLKKVLKKELNIEGFPSRDFLQLIKDNTPHQVTLVPDAINVLTSNEGWDTHKHELFLKDVIQEIKSYKCRVSLFIGTNNKLIEKCKVIGADCIELYTGPYAKEFTMNSVKAINPFIASYNFAKSIGLGINAGHDLNLQNLPYFSKELPHLNEVSIGHALISDALYFGIENTIQMYKSKLKVL